MLYFEAPSAPQLLRQLFCPYFQDLIRDGFVRCVEADLEHTELIINTQPLLMST